MLDFHKTRAALGTLLVHKRARSNSIVTMDDSGRINRFLERPDFEKFPSLEAFWVNSGVSILAPDIFRWIPEGGFCDLPRDVFPEVAVSGTLFGYQLSGYRCAVDSPERYREAQDAIAGGACRIPIERKGTR
jgi:mannose-1-phosphate guanylyltransferase/phosphomannomutase